MTVVGKCCHIRQEQFSRDCGLVVRGRMNDEVKVAARCPRWIRRGSSCGWQCASRSVRSYQFIGVVKHAGIRSGHRVIGTNVHEEVAAWYRPTGRCCCRDCETSTTINLVPYIRCKCQISWWDSRRSFFCQL